MVLYQCTSETNTVKTEMLRDKMLGEYTERRTKHGHY
jgi:hypothetical protein